MMATKNGKGTDEAAARIDVEAAAEASKAEEAAVEALKAREAAIKALKKTEAVVERLKAIEEAEKSKARSEEAAEAVIIKALERASEAAAKTAAEAGEEASKAVQAVVKAKAAKQSVEAYLKEPLKEFADIEVLEAVNKAEEAVSKVIEEETEAAKAAEAALNAAKAVAARAELMKCKKKIKENKRSASGVNILKPSDDSDWKMIKYFPRMNKDVKKNFRNDQYLPDELITIEEAGPQGTGNVNGNRWNKFLGDRIKGKKIEEEAERRVADLIFEELRKPAFGYIQFFDSQFTLNGYIYKKKEHSPEVYFWQGDADAIGWYYNEKRKQYEYVIIDWKVVDLLNWWTKDAFTFGKYLHQCLVYARLLKLHLNLEYLPSVLIVPISGKTGKEIRPGLFRDYPEECKNAIEEFSWHIEEPKPPRNIYGNWPFNNLDEGVVDEEKPLKDLFATGAKVKDLLKAFKFNGLVVIENPND